MSGHTKLIEISPANVLAYLRDHGWPLDEPVRVEPLSGGVSNIVLCIETAGHKVVLKQSCPQLRTRDAWFSDLDRIHREQEVMRMLCPLLPAHTVPRVLFTDEANFLFIMEHAPEGAHVWKQALLAGAVDLAIGKKAGAHLGRMHEATASNPQLVEPFRDHRAFVQLRADPFYERVRERRPEVADAVRKITDEMLARKEALCHGDYTPKNMLVHAGGFTLVDYETACFGDPTMDIGLFLCHLMLKTVRASDRRRDFFALMDAFWAGYSGAVAYRPLAELQARGLRHLAVCLLARIDGTSPVDYLPEEPKRELVRRVSQRILNDNVVQWDEVTDMCERALAAIEKGA